jgi:uncharacterized metal-binding protein
MSERRDVCCSSDAKTLVLACSGGLNAGQIANNVMIELDKKGVGNAYCLAGIGAALSGFVESAKAARTVVVDGCLVGCGKMALKKYGTEPSGISSLLNWVLRKPMISVNLTVKQRWRSEQSRPLYNAHPEEIRNNFEEVEGYIQYLFSYGIREIGF